MDYKELTEEVAMADSKYRGHEIRLCDDGKYRWVYELNLIKNPVIAFTVFKIFAGIILAGWIIFGFFIYVIHGDWEGLWGMTKAMLIALAIFAVLTILGVLVMAWIYGGKYVVLFEMDEKQIQHIQLPRQFKKAQALGILAALAGAASGKPSVAGAGLLAASKQSSTSVFENVRRVKARRWLNLIKVNQLLNHNQIYVPKKDFDFVFNYIKSRCPKAK